MSFVGLSILFSSYLKAENHVPINDIADCDYVWTYGDATSKVVFQMAYGNLVRHDENCYREYGILRVGYRESGYESICWNDGDSRNWPKWLLREESGKVYGVIPEDYRDSYMLQDLSSKLGIDPEYFDWEIPLYDFTLEVGDKALIFDIGGLFLEYDIEAIETLDIGGANRKVFRTEATDFSIIEGLGITCRGCYPYSTYVQPPSFEQTRSDWPPLTTGSYYLYNVMDEVGNVIYGKSFDSGVGLIAEGDRWGQPVVIFDLFGRVVAKPQPGGVYIRGGKKFVYPR